MKAEDCSQQQWRPGALVFCVALAVGLGSSWLWQPTRVVWDQFDHAVFRALNQTLSVGGVWTWGMAVINHRLFDIAGLLLVGAAFLVWIRRDRRSQAGHRLVVAIVFLTLLYGVRGLAELLCHIAEYRRLGPTDIHLDAILLRQVTTINCKDSSSCSFPADHGLLAITPVIFFGLYASWRYMLAACPLLLLALPRLFSGAHWATDILVGTMLEILLIFAIFSGTPWIWRGIDWIETRCAGPIHWIVIKTLREPTP